MKITLVSTMRNEGPHLLEWIAHHRAIGVSDFVIYTNECEDGTDALLDLLPDVHHEPLPDGEPRPQWRALKLAWTHPAVMTADWVACMDCDEFINLGNGLQDIPDLIDRAQADAILLPWRLFGSGGQSEMSDALTTERFLRAAPEHMLYPAIGSYFKTLFRKDGPFRNLGVHRPRQKNVTHHDLPRMVDGSGHELPPQLVANDGQIMNWGHPIARDLVQLNHYSVRSVSEFMTKRARGLPNHRDKQIDLTYWVERNFNQVEDRRILSMIADTRAMMAELSEVTGVTEAISQARAWHRDRLEELLRDPEELKLFGRLQLATGSTPPDDATAMRLIQAYGRAHGR